MPRPLIRSRSRKSSALLPDSLYEGMMRSLHIGAGSLVIALALGIALALISYSPRDPSWNAAVAGNDSVAVHNLIGIYGAYGADIVLQFFGFGSLLLPIIIAAWGWRVASDQGLERLGWRLLASLSAMLSLSVTLGAFGFGVPLEGAVRDGALGRL